MVDLLFRRMAGEATMPVILEPTLVFRGSAPAGLVGPWTLPNSP